MTEYYFDDLENQKRLKIILDEWLDPPTPWRHRCGVKHLGTDCIHFVLRVSEELGLLKWRKDLIPDYPRDWHLHNTRELVSEGLKRELKVEKIDLGELLKKISLGELLNGDIIVSYFGKAASHAGFFFDGYVYQALENIGVCRMNVKDRYFLNRMKFAYRILR
jgi:hypothetical protein